MIPRSIISSTRGIRQEKFMAPCCDVTVAGWHMFNNVVADEAYPYWANWTLQEFRNGVLCDTRLALSTAISALPLVRGLQRNSTVDGD